MPKPKQIQVIAAKSAALACAFCFSGIGRATFAEETFLGKTLTQWNAQLADASEPARLQAVVALGQMGPMAAEGLISALDAEDAPIRHWAAAGLGRIAQAMPTGERAPILRLLKTCLKDSAETVRISAAFALARCGQVEAALPVLAEALVDPIDGARIQAVSALHDLGEAARPVLPALRAARQDETDYVVRLATRAVSRLQGAEP